MLFTRSLQEVFYRKGVLEKSAKFTTNICIGVWFFNKVASILWLYLNNLSTVDCLQMLNHVETVAKTILHLCLFLKKKSRSTGKTFSIKLCQGQYRTSHRRCLLWICEDFCFGYVMKHCPKDISRTIMNTVLCKHLYNRIIRPLSLLIIGNF